MSDGLSLKAVAAQDSYLSKLGEFSKRKTNESIVVALIGLVGSGKSTVARALAPLIGATVVEGDGIRVELRKQGEPYKYVRQITLNVALNVLNAGGNVIIDADHVDDDKRADLEKLASETGVRLVCIRTFADLDVMFGRMLKASYSKSPDDFFGGAKTIWQKGNEQQTGAVVKIREAVRRLPQHYIWTNQGGGRWELKLFPVGIIFTNINTGLSDWKEMVKEVAKDLTIL